jgi:hypothetical protein
MKYLVRISDEALESLALAAVEAFCLGDGQPLADEPTEIFGFFWGHRKFGTDVTTIFIAKASVSVSAHRGENYVIPHPQALVLKDNFVSRWSPHMSFLGEFHTHPFEDVISVQQARGYEFSEQDIDSFVSDAPLWARSGNNPLMLVMTVCRLGRVRESWCTQPRDNVFSFSVGEFRFWLNATVGCCSPNGDRCYTDTRRSAVRFDLNSRYFNQRGDRIHELV